MTDQIISAIRAERCVGRVITDGLPEGHLYVELAIGFFWEMPRDCEWRRGVVFQSADDAMDALKTRMVIDTALGAAP